MSVLRYSISFGKVSGASVATEAANVRLRTLAGDLRLELANEHGRHRCMRFVKLHHVDDDAIVATTESRVR